MANGNSAYVQAGRLCIRHEAVLVVIDGDAVRDVPEQVFHLHAFDCIRVAQRNVEEQRQNLLLEKLWLKTEG